jgi:peptidoglycan/LPS O-acetylase OafA/YrhL
MLVVTQKRPAYQTSEELFLSQAFAPQKETLAHIPELDGLRGLAIVLVLIWHYFVSPLQPNSSWLGWPILKWSLILTWSGVDLFFVLSGFLLAGILLDNKGAVNYFRAFYTRRVCRIFPLYFLWVFLFIGLSLIVLPRVTPGASIGALFTGALPVWSYLTFTQNFVMAHIGGFGAEGLGITWSLAIEEQFYLILPFIIYFIPEKKLPYLLVPLALMAPIVRLLFYYFGTQSGFAGTVLMPGRTDALLVGVLCAYFIRQKGITQFLAAKIKFLYGVLAVFLLGTVFFILLSPFTTSFGMLALGYSWLALLYACFLLIAITEKKGPVTSLLRAKFLQDLGRIAFGVYLIHQTINSLSHSLLLNQIPRMSTVYDVLVTLGALAATILIAYISWSVFEKPIVAWGRSVRYES